MELIDDSGRVERREQVQGSTFKICDFGFGPHTLRVGTNDCLPVSVSNLRVVLGRPLHLTVFMNMCGYQENTRTGCFLYLRAVDRHGVPVSDAGLVFPPGMQAYGKTDSYGRLQTLVPRGTTEILLVKDGFGSGKAQSKCSDNEEIDLAVRMEEKAAGSKEH
jgi:hypothetical protein